MNHVSVILTKIVRVLSEQRQSLSSLKISIRVIVVVNAISL